MLSKEIEQFFKKRYEGWTGSNQFEGTSDRIHRMVEEMFWTPTKINTEVEKCFKSTFPNDYNEMLVAGPTLIWTTCPHHLLPVNLKVYIGYIPNGKVLGLSKFSRVAIAMGKRPIMQEQYSLELADTFNDHLKPKGCGVHVTGTHGCMMCRGVGQTVPIATSMLKGNFMIDSKVRSEFYNIIMRGISNNG